MKNSFVMIFRFAAMTGLWMMLAQPLAAQPNYANWVCRTNDMWINLSNSGSMGNDGMSSAAGMTDPCPPNSWAPQCELPGGSGQEYLYYASLWIGAIVVEDGVEQPRVSVSNDGWMNPSIMEFWPGTTGSITQRSRVDTVNCLGEQIYDSSLPADDEISTVFTDTLSASPYVLPDPADGPHFPLGIEVKADYFTMRSVSCNHIYWIRYRIKNIGNHLLKNLYFGQYVDGDVGLAGFSDEHTDDLTGYDSTSQIAYICDNDGRHPYNSSGPPLVSNVTGMTFLSLPAGAQVSFNWWASNGDMALDFGPAWSDYADRDSLGMGWTQRYGTPMGDAHKYQLMSNGEWDFDQVYFDSLAWMAAHPQNGHTWSTTDRPSNAYDLANGNDARYMLSAGPFGSRVGDHTELAAGDSLEIWMAYVGGLNFHDPNHPQPTNAHIDPTLFDFADLRARAAAARSGECFAWNLSMEKPRPTLTPAAFTLEPVYPNPFNSSTMIRFTVQRVGRVEIAVYDVTGRQVEKLAEGDMSAGTHAISWSAKGLPSGIYFVRGSGGNQAMQVQKALLIR
jgi:hypothetical protein